MSFGKAPSEGHNTGLSIFEDYPARASRLSGKERKQIKRTAQDIFEQSPSDAISFLSGYRGYTNFRPDSLIGKFMARPVDYERFRPVGSSAFQDLLGRDMTEQEFNQATEYAKTMGIKDPNAFQSFLNTKITSSEEGARKIRSEADRQWESLYGTMPRDAQGNLMRGLVAFNPTQAQSIANMLIG